MNSNTATTILGIAAIIADTLAARGVAPEITGSIAIALGGIFAILTNQPPKETTK